MSNKEKRTASYWLFWGLALIVAFMFSGCSKKSEPSQTMAVTARFTSPVEIESQPSDKCIACHTKTHPITKLASEPVASSHGGEGG
ncbi:MAG: hypothetical protein PHU24_01600 [Sphaerochaetaceae bacterium]|jgi:hypothetical protein|nr:hypothetical protein [Sphaerochaetaceae bacterium]NLO61383.1 hypothetical protein [Spirochaetales bacterium]MDD2405133.1 hypothetical protein [Sphaerochaetaceae bacterium]MDD4258915.1 hypothetical protein [Sphaerochaetaceae bacterium]MDD4763725.1 hypothetical protein [Sphaerochaetaceae bacterium]